MEACHIAQKAQYSRWHYPFFDGAKLKKLTYALIYNKNTTPFKTSNNTKKARKILKVANAILCKKSTIFTDGISILFNDGAKLKKLTSANNI